MGAAVVNVLRPDRTDTSDEARAVCGCNVSWILNTEAACFARPFLQEHERIVVKPAKGANSVC
eukprot:6204656-Pleurochrysis_carterae.AAC.3